MEDTLRAPRHLVLWVTSSALVLLCLACGGEGEGGGADAHLLQPLSPPDREPMCGTSYKEDGRTILLEESGDETYAIVDFGGETRLEQKSPGVFGNGRIEVEIRGEPGPTRELVARAGGRTSRHTVTLGGGCEH